MGEWQPIESAPKDGTRILLGYFGDAEHMSGAIAVGHVFQWERMPKALVASWLYGVEPTHWASLPSPPESAA